MSINVVALITAKPGSEAIVRAALEALVTPTRAEEGNVSYDLTESAQAPGTFITIEEWSEPGDLEKHLQTEHVAGAFAAAGEHLAAPPAIHWLNAIPID